MQDEKSDIRALIESRNRELADNRATIAAANETIKAVTRRNEVIEAEIAALTALLPQAEVEPWRPEPPRGGAVAVRRLSPPGAGFDDYAGTIRGFVGNLLLETSTGIEAAELPGLIAARASPRIRERFEAMGSYGRRLKNAQDALYFLRESQERLGLVVERSGRRWRARRKSPV